MKIYCIVLLFFVAFAYSDPPFTPVPNIEYMLAGLDMRYGDPLNVTLRNPIFESLSYNDGHTVTINGITHKMPDQLYVLAYPSEQKTSTTMVYYSASLVEESLFESFTIGFDCKRINGSFSLSEQVSYFNYMYNSQASYTPQLKCSFEPKPL